jgi:hypothetical protein
MLFGNLNVKMCKTVREVCKCISYSGLCARDGPYMYPIEEKIGHDCEVGVLTC